MSIICSGIAKTYQPKSKQPVEALAGIDLQIHSGEVYGVLGQNGAGKTTLIQILSTQLLASAGQGSVLGLDLVRDKQQLRQRINVINGGEAGLYPWLSPVQMLEYFGYLYKLPRKVIKQRTTELLTLVGLDPAAWKRPCMSLSKGMKQRVMIAKGLVNDPELIFLDEPTIGLDVKAVRDTRTLIASWAEAGKTVVLTSHNMGDIEAVCNRLCVIQDGQIQVERHLDELKSNYKALVTLTLAGQWAQHAPFLSAQGNCYEIEQRTDCLSLKIALPSEHVSQLYQYFATHPESLQRIEINNETLEDLYLEIVGKDQAA